MKLGLAFCGLAVFGIVHHRLVSGGWWDWYQFWHHESLIIMSVTAGVAILIVRSVWRKQ